MDMILSIRYAVADGQENICKNHVSETSLPDDWKASRGTTNRYKYSTSLGKTLQVIG